MAGTGRRELNQRRVRPRPNFVRHKGIIKTFEVFEVAARKREKTESTVLSGGKGSPVRRRTKVMSTIQASDRDAAMWDMRFAKAEMDGGIETDSVGNPYEDDPDVCKRAGSRKARRR
jgi:hypothetical protein